MYSNSKSVLYWLSIKGCKSCLLNQYNSIQHITWSFCQQPQYSGLASWMEMRKQLNPLGFCGRELSRGRAVTTYCTAGNNSSSCVWTPNPAQKVHIDLLCYEDSSEALVKPQTPSPYPVKKPCCYTPQCIAKSSASCLTCTIYSKLSACTGFVPHYRLC